MTFTFHVISIPLLTVIQRERVNVSLCEVWRHVGELEIHFPSFLTTSTPYLRWMVSIALRMILPLRKKKPGAHSVWGWGPQSQSGRFEEEKIFCSYLNSNPAPFSPYPSHYAEYPYGLFNLLKPSGHVMHQQFNIQQLYALPTLYLCVLYLSENKQRLVPLTA